MEKLAKILIAVCIVFVAVGIYWLSFGTPSWLNFEMP
jgi:hypothetical protein